MSKLAKEVRETKAYYEKNAEKWASTHTNSFYHEKQFVYFKDLLTPNASVIDVGCGSGALVPLFLGIGKGLRYYGVDIAEKLIAIAKRHYPQLTFTEGNIADRNTLPKKKFDGFIATSVLMHLPFTEWDTAFSNIESLTRPSAYGYVVLPVEGPQHGAQSTDTRHFTILTEEEQSAYMKNRGWKIVKKYKLAPGCNKTQWVGYIVKLPEKH